MRKKGDIKQYITQGFNEINFSIIMILKVNNIVLFVVKCSFLNRYLS